MFDIEDAIERKVRRFMSFLKLFVRFYVYGFVDFFRESFWLFLYF